MMKRLGKLMAAVTAAAALAAVVLPAAGCYSDWVEVDGVRYRALSKDQIDDLVYRALLVLYHNSKTVSREDYRAALAQKPEIDLSYTGDCRGTAKLTWRLAKRDITVEFSGNLDSDRPMYKGEGINCLMRVNEHVPEVIDFTSRQKGGAVL